MAAGNTLQFDSIGSRFWLERLDSGVFDQALIGQIKTYCQDFDNKYSRFKDDSLIAQLASSGILHNPPSELLAMLTYAKGMFAISEGAFNVTVGGALNTLGYGNRAYASKVVDRPWEKISWTKSIVHSPVGVRLDFGGFGKGWMIDEIAKIMELHGVTEYIVNGGGDLYVKSHKPITITLENPNTPGTALQTVQLQNAALAGSDTVKRAWSYGKVTKHHIIDPALQDSSDSGVVGSYVIANSALIADTIATIVVIRPALLPVLERHFGVKTLLIHRE